MAAALVVFVAVAVETSLGITGFTLPLALWTHHALHACVAVAIAVAGTTCLPLTTRADAGLTLETATTSLAVLASAASRPLRTSLTNPPLTTKTRLAGARDEATTGERPRLTAGGSISATTISPSGLLPRGNTGSRGAGQTGTARLGIITHTARFARTLL